MADPPETCHLLVSTASEGSSPLQQKGVCISCPPSKHLCLPSKAAILILLWTATVGAIFNIFVGMAAVFQIDRTRIHSSISVYEPLPYAILALVMMFYPLSGFIADVCCGRLKIAVVGLVLLLSCLIMLLIGILILDETTIGSNFDHSLRYDRVPSASIIILVSLSAFTFIVGLAGYQANFIQLGLDQLFEAPSQYLVLFIHYAIWGFQSGSVSFVVISFLMLCSCEARKTLALTFASLYILLLAVLLLIGCLKRQWFHIEPGHQNPYRTVYNIINFAKSHKYPLRRSAFTHNDDYIPSRLDFAKERFGGPFTTEQVENVKTLFWMLLILFAVGPVFALEVPGSYLIYLLFGSHLLHLYHHHNYKEYCTKKYAWNLMMGSGAVMSLVSTVVLFPAYIWIIFHHLRKKVPKLFVRLGIGILLCLLGVVSLLITDAVGHVSNRNSFSNISQCVFQATLSTNKSLTYPSLNMHWGVLVPPSLLLGIGPFLVISTTLEFISAQSPQSMKGLLVGVFFAIRGLFQFLNSIVIIPLSQKHPWASREMIEHPQVINCGFVYLMLTSVTGLIGLILFSLAAKRYKYRTRDEGMFSQHDVEEIYGRYLDQN